MADASNGGEVLDTSNDGETGDASDGNETPDADGAPSPLCTLDQCSLFFTEVMVNTCGGEPGTYLELFNPGATVADVRGCVLELEFSSGKLLQHTIMANAPLSVGSEAYLVIGSPGVAGVDYQWTDTMELPTLIYETATVRLRNPLGNVEVAHFTYGTDGKSMGTSVPAQAKCNESFQLSANALTCEASHVSASWCAISAGYPPHKPSTKGEPNGECPTKPLGCQLGPCGMFFTELAVDPDGSGTYVELYNPDDEAADIRGCSLHLDYGGWVWHTITADQPVAVPPGCCVARPAPVPVASGMAVRRAEEVRRWVGGVSCVKWALR